VGQEYTVSNLSSGLRGDEHLSWLTAPQAGLVEHGLSSSAKNHQPDRSDKPDKPDRPTKRDRPNEQDTPERLADGFRIVVILVGRKMIEPIQIRSESNSIQF
jgi:hypothetical protein